jgi:hypothetical protein
MDLGQATSSRVLLTDDTSGVPGVVGGVVSDEVAGVVAAPAPEALETFPAASKARTVYE